MYEEMNNKLVVLENNFNQNLMQHILLEWQKEEGLARNSLKLYKSSKEFLFRPIESLS